jgi:hypothetical protein
MSGQAAVPPPAPVPPPEHAAADHAEVREREAALERGDEIVQQLSIAKYALAVGDMAQAIDAIDAALATSRDSLSELADDSGRAPHTSYAGALVRSTAAASTTPVTAPVEEPDQRSG